MATFIQSGDPGREKTPPRLRKDLRQRRPRAVVSTEFAAALAAFGIKQRSAAQWFRTSERNIRRWKSGTRKTPPGVAVVVRLMLAGKVTIADVELAASLIATRTSGGAEGEPLASLEEPSVPLEEASQERSLRPHVKTPAPEQSAPARAP